MMSPTLMIKQQKLYNKINTSFLNYALTIKNGRIYPFLKDFYGGITFYKFS